MRIVKFEGSTMRDALGKVKAELGDTAVVVSTRQIRRGLLGTAYEIAAAIDTDEPSPAPAFARPVAPPQPTPAPELGHDVETAIAPVRAELRSLRAMVRAASDGRAAKQIEGELVALRKLLEDLHANREQAPRPAPSTAGRTGSGFAVAGRSGNGGSFPTTMPSTARIIALVGPTGVGKTTTIAKLAARAALADGRRVAVITVDSYRIGGVDQIRTFTDLIGVPLGVVSDPDELPDVVDSFADCDLILIDTTGRSPRDANAIAGLAATLQLVRDIEVHLTVPAAATSAMIDDLYRRYRPLAPKRLLFTKLDEVDEAPELACAPSRLGLPLTWIATGQQVPEDLEEPTAARITELSGIPPASTSPSAPHGRASTVAA